MRKIDKGVEPSMLTVWKRKNPNGQYADLDDVTRRAIRQVLLEEQYYLCAHCCQALASIDDCHNEHVEAQNISQNRTLDYTNLVASCNVKNQCGDAHKSQALPLTPLMDECETELVFKISGRVEGCTERAKETIRVLNLGDTEQHNESLVEKRKQFAETLLWKNGVDPKEGLEDEELIQLVIDDISKPNADGKLEAFAPVVVNILRGWLQE